MKIFEVELAVYYNKKFHVKAPDREAAEALAETIFRDTDAVKLTQDDLEDLEAFAISIDGSDDDDDDDCCDNDFDEDEELPFEEGCDPRERLLELMQCILDSVSDHEVTIHISP